VDEEVFGRYRLRSVIGQGGMGVVYQAYDTAMDRDVAIKVLAAELGAEPGYRERFRREAHAAAKLADPHVIAVHDAGEIDGRLYLVMPVIEGTDMASVLAREGRLAPGRAVNVIEQLASALDAAHAAGLVHRDIKPSNALLTRRDFVYLIDFGIVQNNAAGKMTRTGALLGTAAYMAPERLAAGRTDAGCDIYALACVLYECLTGTAPYPGSLEQQLTAHLAADPPAPSATDPALGAFDHVIATGMAKDPDQRYGSASALAAAAREAVTDSTGGPSAALMPPAPRAGTVIRPEPGAEYPPTVIRPGPPQLPPPVPRPTTYVSPTAPQGFTEYFWAPVGPGETVATRRRWVIPAAISGATLIVAAGVIGYFGLTRQSAAPVRPSQAASASTPEINAGPSHSGNGLVALLLPSEQIDTAMGTSGMAVVGTMSSMVDNSFAVSDMACLPLSASVQTRTYQGSGYTAVSAQVVAKGQQNAVDQAVVEFPSGEAASRFFASSRSGWQACSDRTFALSAGGNSQLQTVGRVSEADGLLTATVAPANSPGKCERALMAVTTFVIDVTACAGPAGAAADVARQIAANVAARR